MGGAIKSLWEVLSRSFALFVKAFFAILPPFVAFYALFSTHVAPHPDFIDYRTLHLFDTALLDFLLALALLSLGAWLLHRIFFFWRDTPVARRELWDGEPLLDQEEAEPRGLGRKEKTSWWKRHKDKGTPPPQSHTYFWGTDLPEKAATQHFFITGITGSGKTLFARALLADAVSTFSKPGFDSRIFLLDIETDAYPVLRRLGLRDSQINLLNPFSVNGVGWAIGEDIREQAHIVQVAADLGPPSSGDSRDPFFPRASRSLIQAVIEVFVEKSGTKWTLRDVLCAFSSSDVLRAVLKSTVRGTEAEERVFGGADPRTSSNIYLTSCVDLVQYEVVAACWHQASRSVSLKQWTNESTVLVLGYDDSAKEALSAINRILFTRAAQISFDGPIVDSDSDRIRRSFFFLDEAQEIGRLNLLHSLLTRGRKRGVSVMLAFQDTGDWWDTYKKGTGSAIINQCANKVFLALGDEPANWASAQFGNADYRQTTESRAADGSVQEGDAIVTAPRVPPEKFKNIKLPLVTGLVKGYAKNPWCPAGFHFEIGAKAIAERATLSNVSVEEQMMRRPKNHQELKPWTEGDHRRLNLMGVPITNSVPSSQIEQAGLLANIA